jgi:hypothetical protein
MKSSSSSAFHVLGLAGCYGLMPAFVMPPQRLNHLVGNGKFEWDALAGPSKNIISPVSGYYIHYKIRKTIKLGNACYYSM